MSVRTRWLPVILLVLLTVAGFSATVGNEFVIYDDDLYINRNYVVRGGLSLSGAAWAFTTTQAANWHPLTWLSHMLDVELFGLDPGAHHAVGLGLHALNTLLLFALLLRATGAPWRSGLVAALFAVHPLHVESVAWASERKDLLSTALALLALLAWLRHLARPSTARLAGVCALFALALMAKPMPVTLPFLMLLLDWWPLGRWAPLGPSALGGFLPPLPLWREKAPLFALAAASSAVTFFAQRTGGALTEVLPATHRLSNAIICYLKYLGKAVWPSRLAIPYPYPREQFDPVVVIAALLALAALTLVALRLSRRCPWLAVGWLWYLGMLVPVIGLVQVGTQAMADRYTYLPLTGVLLVAAWALAELARARPARIVPIAAGVLVLLGALTTATRGQVTRWRDTVTLFRHTLEVTGPNWVAYNNLGLAHMARGDAAAAVANYREALELLPRSAEAYNNFGHALAVVGRMEEAEMLVRRAIAIDPRLAQAHANLGTIEMRRSAPAKALEHYREALRLDPENAETLSNLGALLATRGELPQAISLYRKALALDPFSAETTGNLGIALRAIGDHAAAGRLLRDAVRLDPRSPQARFNLGSVLLEDGEVAEAVEQLAEAVRLNPDDPAAHAAVDDAYRRLGRRSD